MTPEKANPQSPIDKFDIAMKTLADTHQEEGGEDLRSYLLLIVNYHRLRLEDALTAESAHDLRNQINKSKPEVRRGSSLRSTIRRLPQIETAFLGFSVLNQISRESPDI